MENMLMFAKDDDVDRELRAWIKRHGELPEDPAKVDAWLEAANELSEEARATFPPADVVREYAKHVSAAARMVDMKDLTHPWSGGDCIAMLFAHTVMSMILVGEADGRDLTQEEKQEIITRSLGADKWATMREVTARAVATVLDAMRNGVSEEQIRAGVRATLEAIARQEATKADKKAMEDTPAAGMVFVMLLFKYLPDYMRERVMDKPVGEAVRWISSVLGAFMQDHVPGGAEAREQFAVHSSQAAAYSLLAIFDREMDRFFGMLSVMKALQEGALGLSVQEGEA